MCSSDLSTAPLLASLELFDAAGGTALQAKAREMTSFLESALRARLERAIAIVTPARPEARGCQLSLRVRDGRETGLRVHHELAAQGILTDWREPDIIRAAPVPLYNRFEDAARLVLALERTLTTA